MNTISDTSFQTGHDFRKQGVSKIEVNLTKNVLRTVSHCIYYLQTTVVSFDYVDFLTKDLAF